MDINQSIFKAYDIRGVYPQEFNEETAYIIGRSFVVWLQGKFKINKPLVTVGSDARLSSPKLKKNLIKGILDQGGKVIDIGLATTPMFYFSVNKLKADGGMMVTASHNPARYNGIKLTLKQAKPVGAGSGMEEIKELVLRGEFESVLKKGRIKKKNFLRDYIKFLYSFSPKNFGVKGKMKLKVAIDSGNGMAGLVLLRLFKKIKGIKVVSLYFKIDCRFPNHEANPLKKETLEDLQKLIKKSGADFGIAFDGDGDRVGFLDSKGEFVGMDLITAFLAKDYLQKHPGAIVAYDIRSSRVVREIILEYGGKPIVSRVGHSFFKKHLWEDGAEFGGELSGHYFFKEFFNADSGIFAMLKVLRIIGDEQKSFDELIKPFRRYFSSGEINFKIEDKTGAMKCFEKRFSKGEISKLDGLSVEYKDWRFNLRSSNTEPLLRLNFEADTKKLFEEKKKILMSLIKKFK